MAGSLKPSISNILEGVWVINGFLDAYGQIQGNGLFDGVRGSYNSSNAFYWAGTDKYIDITLNQKSNIWALPSSGDLNYTGTLTISKYISGTWTDITAQVEQYPRSSVDNEWKKVILNLDAGRYKFTCSTGNRIDGEWFIENLEPYKTKYLIQYNSTLYTYDGVNIVESQSQTLDDINFKNNGFSDPTLISETIWKSKFTDLSQVRLLTWTDNTSKSEMKLVYTCNQFELTQWLKDNQCQLLAWTDDTTKTKLDIVYNCDPYIIWDKVKLGAKLLKYDGSIISIEQTKTGYRLLLQDGTIIEATDGLSFINADVIPYTIDKFIDKGMNNLSNMNNSIVGKLQNNKYKVALYKVK